MTVTSVPLKFVAHVNRYELPASTDPDYLFRYVEISDVSEDGTLNIPTHEVRFADAPSRARRIAPQGSTVVSTVRTYLKAVAHVPVADLIFSTGFAVLEPREVIDERFLTFACQEDSFISEVVARSVGISYPAINAPDLAGIPIRLPTLMQQRRIADFLDDQVTLIDRAITLRELQLGLLHQRLRSSVEANLALMRAESNDMKLGRLLSERNTRAGRTCGMLPLLSVSIHHGVQVRSLLAAQPPSNGLDMYKVVKAGDFVLNRMRAFQGGLGVSRLTGLVSPDYAVLSISNVLCPDYMHFTARSPWFVGEMTARLRGIGGLDQGQVRTPRINVEDLLDISIPVPSLGTQQRFASQVGEIAERDACYRDSIVRHVGLLQERKRALITACASGEFDVASASTRAADAVIG